MGQRSSKQKNPWAALPPGFYPPGSYGPNAAPFIPPGFQPPPGVQPPYLQFGAQGQPGFIPPGMYGQAGMGMPQPQLNWLPGDKEPRKDRKGKRRAQSEQFPGGFVAGPNGPGFPQAHISTAGPDNDGPVIPDRRSSKRKSGSSGGRRRASTSTGRPPLLTTPRGTGVPLNNFPTHDRVHTPFNPPRERDESDSSDTDDDDDLPPGIRPPPRRSQSTNQPRVTGRIDDVLRPLPPADKSAFGPTGQRPNVNLWNPLPDPPRDLYEMTPYRSLLTLPQTTALLAYGTAQQQNSAANIAAATTVVIPSGGVGTQIIPASVLLQQQQQQQQAESEKTQAGKKKGMGGLFRALSKKGRGNQNKESTSGPVVIPIIPQPAKVQFVPVFVDKKPDHGGGSQSQQGHQYQQQQQPARTSGGRASSVDNSGDLDNSFDLHEHHQQQQHHHDDDDDDFALPQPHPPPDPGPLEFDQLSTAYAGFMNHSPHRILYKNKMYPTATHLHEALKYLPAYPDLAERIRQVPSVVDVYPMSATMEQFQREDWAQVFLGQMEEVLLHKFIQHANLRDKLATETGQRQLVYADVLDGFWGLGPDGNGQNQLGRVLMNVREKLRRDGGMR